VGIPLRISELEFINIVNSVDIDVFIMEGDEKMCGRREWVRSEEGKIDVKP
jgi:hypothetical protein